MGSMEIAVLFAITFFFTMPALSEASVLSEKLKREIGEDFSTTEMPEKYCYEEMPCGWVVFDRMTNGYLTTVFSPCICREDAECVQIRVDMAKYSYVFGCRPIENSTHVMYFPPAEPGEFKAA